MLTEKDKTEILELAGHYYFTRAASIEALKIVQKHHGWVSDESIKAVAELLGMSAEELDNVATFYNLILRKPVGRHVIYLCNSISCHIMGCTSLSDYLRKHLQIEFGETSPDGRFTLIPICCLGACDKAPVLMVGSDTYENVSPETLKTILERYQ